MTSLRHLSAGSLLLLVLTGCTTDAPPPNIVPPAPAEATVEQLSGTYCYFGPDFNLRAFRRDPKLIPFLDVEALGEPTKVSVAATAEEIRFTYTNRDGVEVNEVLSPGKLKATWQEGALVVPWKEVRPNVGAMVGLNVVGNVLGLALAGILHSDSYTPFVYAGGRKRESRLFRLADGRLVMSDTLRASGALKEEDMASGAWAREDSVALLLDPADGDCAAPSPDQPLQPRFERGLDLRVPACADRLAEQFASVLVEKGEPEDVARRVSNETVDGLIENGGNWAEFWLETPSGVTYKFDVGKKDDGCVLRMFGRVKRTRTMTSSMENRIWFLAKRPLPECACN
jgi:hypothetical protein